MLIATLSLAVWIYLLVGHGRFWQAGPMLPPAPGGPTPAVAVVVPARNEAESIVACLRSLLAQDYPGPMRVVMVDDLSTDGTGGLAGLVRDPRLTVLRGAPHPPAWSGKLWALQQGIEAAGPAELLLLTDADIVHAPGHLASLVAKIEGGRLDMVSEMVALHCESLAERALVPAFVFFFQLLYPFAWVNDPGNPVAAAAGGTVLIRAEMLSRVGGLAAMRGALIDDVTLARRVKAVGRIWLGHGGMASSLRPYETAGDVWRMVARCAYVQLGHSPWALSGTVAGMALVWLVPPAAGLFGHGATRLVGLLGWAVMTGCYLPTLRRFGQNPLWAAGLPAVAVFYGAATLGSALDHYRGRGVVWKQRAYHG
jgi:hopene-associated glycosyltransferase HpnB